MRFRLAFLVVFCGLLASCAYQGVIVDKSVRELPFGESYGLGGSLAFMLKDNAGTVRRQLVTPDVFMRYEVGDYFNDLQPGPARQQRSSDGKTMLTASSAEKTAPRVAARSKTQKTQRFAKKGRNSQKSIAVAKRARAKKMIVPTVKREQAHIVATVVALPQPETAFVGVRQIRRCR